MAVQMEAEEQQRVAEAQEQQAPGGAASAGAAAAAAAAQAMVVPSLPGSSSSSHQEDSAAYAARLACLGKGGHDLHNCGEGAASLVRDPASQRLRFRYETKDGTPQVLADHLVPSSEGPGGGLRPHLSAQYTLVWAAWDNFQGEWAMQTFVLRFNKAEAAAEFQARFAEAQEEAREQRALFQEEAKLWSWHGEVWRSEGRGEVKLLQAPARKLVCLQLLKETGEALASDVVDPDDCTLVLHANASWAWTWSAGNKTYALKFATQELAAAFEAKVRPALEIKSEGPPPVGTQLSGKRGQLSVDGASTLSPPASTYLSTDRNVRLEALSEPLMPEVVDEPLVLQRPGVLARCCSYMANK